MDELQKHHLISYLFLDRGKVVKYKIHDWKKHNTVLDYNCLCQKDIGFFFILVVVATELVSAGRCSEMDYISLMSFSRRTGSVIYLHSYLSTMFQISDVLVDKEEVAMVLKINVTLPNETDSQAGSAATAHEVCVSEELSSVSKSNIEAVINKMAQVLDAQGISCFRCPKSIYKLYPLSDACREEYISHIPKTGVRFGMTVLCGENKPVYTFELTLSTTRKDREGGSKSGRNEHC